MAKLIYEVPADKAKEGIAAIKKALLDMGEKAEVVEKQFAKQEKGIARAGRAYERAARQLDPTIRKTQDYERQIKALERGVEAAGKDQDEANRLLAVAKQRYAEAGNEAQRMGGQVSGVSSALESLGPSIVAVFSVATIKRFTAALIEAEVTMQSIEKRLLVASGGDRAGAADEFAFVRAEAERLGLSLEQLAGGYARLAVATRGTKLEGRETQLIFSAVAEAAAAMGLNSQELERVLLALEQMVSKGNISAEEMRRQLGNALPGAFQIAARAMGVTTAEFGKMLESGLAAEEFLPRFRRELHDTFGPEAEQNVVRLQGSINALDNALLKLKVSAKSGEALAPWARAAADAIDALSDSIEAASKRMGGRSLASDLGYLIPGVNLLKIGHDIFGGGDDSLNREKAAVLEVATAYDVAGRAKSDALDPKAMDAAVKRNVKNLEDEQAAAEKLAEAFQRLRDKYDPWGAAVRSLAADQAALVAAFEAGKIPRAEMIRQLDELEKKLVALTEGKAGAAPDIEILPERFKEAEEEVQKLVDGLGQMDNAVDPVIDAQGQMIQKQIDYNRQLERAVALAYELAGTLSQLGGFLSAIGISEGAAISQYASLLGQATDLYGAAAGLYGKYFGASATGIYGPTQAGGNIAASGSAAGAAWAGAAFAAVVLIGKKQLADTRKLQLFQSGASGSLEGGVVSASYGGRLERTAQLIAEQLAAALTSVVAESGIFVEALDKITVLARNDKKLFELRIADEFKGRFESANDAILAGIRQQLLGPEFADQLDPIVKQVVRNFDGLAENLGSAMGRVNDLLAEARGLEGFDIHLETLVDQIHALRNELESLGVSRLDASKLSGEIGLSRFENAWNELAGIQMSPEQLRAQAEARRAILISELELYRLETQMDIDALTARIAAVGAEGQLVQIEIETWRGHLRGRELYVRRSAELMQAELAILEARMEAIDDLLGTIKVGKIKIPNFGRHVDRFGSHVDNLGDRWESAMKSLVDYLDSSALGPNSPFTGREQVALALEDLSSLYQRALGGDVAAGEELQQSFADFERVYQEFTAGGQGFLGDFRAVSLLWRDRLRELATGSRPDRLHVEQMGALSRLHDTARSHLANDTSARRESDTNLKNIKMAEETTRKSIESGFRSLERTISRTAYFTTRTAA